MGRIRKRHEEPLGTSDAQALIENIVRAQAPEIADCWFWGSPSTNTGARGNDGRTLFAYWQTDVARHERLVPRMEKLRGDLQSLDAIDMVVVRDYEPDTAYTGTPVVGEQWEIRLNVPLDRPTAR